MRMAPTDEAPARGTGELVELDLDTRTATIRHGALDALDWPAMTSHFPVRADVSLDRLTVGQQVAFRAARGADGLLGLIDLGRDDGVAATGTGTVLAITADGKLTLAHDPIPELDWPAMQMDMPVSGVDLVGVPLDEPVEFDLSRGDDGLFTVVAVRGDGMATPDAMPVAVTSDAAPMSNEAPPIVVSGRIDSLDVAARMATITHGPITEIGMPGMTMNFALGEALDPGTLATGVEQSLTFARPDGMTMILIAADPLEPPMEVIGTINAIDPATGLANITHGPMVEIGMPGMTMDFAVDPDINIAALPEGREVTLLLKRNADFSLMLVGITQSPDVLQ
jgi:Cu(I)/Ag(I) efflux system membrane fusion protein